MGFNSAFKGLKLNLQILKLMQFTKAGSWCEIDGTGQSNLNVMVLYM